MFLALKTSVKMELGDINELRSASEQFMKIAPENPIALAAAALLAATEPPSEEETEGQRVGPTESCRRAIDLLQKALECSPSGIPIQIYDALGVLAERLIAEGLYLAGREHLAFQVLLDRENAQVPYAKLIRISRAPSISLLLRQDMTVPPCPEGVAWEVEYNEAIGEGSRGLWRKAANLLEALLERHQRLLSSERLGSSTVGSPRFRRRSTCGGNTQIAWACRMTMRSKPKRSRNCSTPRPTPRRPISSR